MTEADHQRAKVKHLIRRFSLKKGREPTETELAYALGMTTAQVRALSDTNKSDYSNDNFEELVESLRSLLNKDPELLKLLSPRERLVIRIRLGLEDGQERTEVETSEIIGLPLSVVRTTQLRAVFKLGLRK